MSKEIEFVSGYSEEIINILKALPREPFDEIMRTLQAAREAGKVVYTCGNGGSAAAASHMACDFGKNTRQEGKTRVRAICLNDNVPAVMAYANDEGYDIIFSEQLESLGNRDDVLIAISGSGNSANILKAIETAKKKGMKVIGLTGFKGGKMKDKVDICLVVPSDSMEMIEDIHLIINHMIAGLYRGGKLYGK